MTEVLWPIRLWQVELEPGNVYPVEATHWDSDGEWVRFYVSRPWLACGRDTAHSAFKFDRVTAITQLYPVEDQQLTPPQA